MKYLTLYDPVSSHVYHSIVHVPQSKQFFKSPAEVKQTCAVGSGKSVKNSGRFGMNTETLDPGKQKRGDFKEYFLLDGEDIDIIH
jgi:isopenicillin N synthase-like dioxygenase